MFFRKKEPSPDFFGNIFPTEKDLVKEFGKCSQRKLDINLLCITDTHGALEEDFLTTVESSEYDVCVLLGDHDRCDIEVIQRCIPKNKLYGLLGNHDRDYLMEYGINSLHGNLIDVNGCRILGMNGCFAYKEGWLPNVFFTQERSQGFLHDKPYCDIFVSHDGGYNESKATHKPVRESHQGLIGITEYLFRERCLFHIHGHTHRRYEYRYLNGTKEICLGKNDVQLLKL